MQLPYLEQILMEMMLFNPPMISSHTGFLEHYNTKELSYVFSNYFSVQNLVPGRYHYYGVYNMRINNVIKCNL